MRWIMTANRAGKTTEAIRVAADGGYVIVAADSARAGRIKQMALSLGLQIPEPITATQFASRQNIHGQTLPRGYVIDDADDMMRAMAGPVPIVAATCTITEGPEIARPDRIGTPCPHGEGIDPDGGCVLCGGDPFTVGDQ